MKYIDIHINKETPIAPLVTFRVLFGFIMLISTIRFSLNGWIYTQYIAPEFFFPYYGFEWIQPLPDFLYYVMFAVIGISALMIMLGAYYRFATISFFLCFTYMELLDKTNYLNHYYLVSILGFLLIWVPANRHLAIDAWRKPWLQRTMVPAWTINIFKLQLSIVYCYAGLAKLNYDWLIEAKPLKIWLPANSHLPIIGNMLKYSWIAYFFSWFGAIYDLLIPVFLLLKKTRPFAFAAVIFFHLMTWILFPIGMFPFIMILNTLIFFPASFHMKLQAQILRIWPFLKNQMHSADNVYQDFKLSAKRLNIITCILILHFVIQFLFPWRYMLYPGNIFWTEEGYRFSWRVMLMEKAGYVVFEVEDPDTNRKGEVYAGDYLTPNQEKMMATQPDMILQFAHMLKDKYQQQGIKNPIIRVNANVTLNGNGARLYLDQSINLASIRDGFKHKDWILPLKD